ncbi:MAG: hypothetical protein IKJ45_01850 [Kiritimatiellae bacterium]|nr:hypothetical protein [Kiritimatiellia bacterium]
MAPWVVRKQSIYRTIFKHGNATPQLPPHLYKSGGSKNSFSPTGRLDKTTWGWNLLALVNEVQEAVFAGRVEFEQPRMIQVPKGYRDGRMEFREVASFDSVADRVILSRMTAYVRDVLESVLTGPCYSFRKDGAITHQLAVERLKEWRGRFVDGSLVVAECDIKKFFDNISHDVVRRRWNEVGFDAQAEKVLEAYLNVYATKAGRGLPQGGSFSTVLANLVLAEADAAVLRVAGEGAFYARYCDDVVFASADEAECRRMMSAYEEALARLDLPMHPVEPFIYRSADGRKTRYYSIKSKGLFRWKEAECGEENCAPWVSFLGCQVRYDGETRIREESIDKHIRTLGHETAAKVREVEAGALDGKPRDEVAKWFACFRNRLIAKGVGYVTAKVKDCQLCWAGAFPNVTACTDTKMQMRRLDRVRNGMLTKVLKTVAAKRGKAIRLFKRYKGRPFSYFGFLEKIARPTNLRTMRDGEQANMVRRRVLPYSEL